MSYQQEKFKEIADKIREKTGITDKIKPSEFAGLQDDVFEAGKQAENKRFWDLYQEEGYKQNYSNAFSGPSWTIELFKPRYDIKPTVAYMVFRASGLEGDLVEIAERLGIVIDFSSCTNLQFTFLNSKLTRIGTVGGKFTTNLEQTFREAEMLHTIDKLILKKENKIIRTFEGCTALENITIEGTIGTSFDIHWSPLSKASIESIVSALSDTVTEQTVTFNNERIDTIYTESEWASVVATKPNWTFALL